MILTIKDGTVYKVLEKALKKTNKKWDGNIILKDWKYLSKNRIQFTIRAKQSKIRGASVSYSGRNSVAANWHVHGDLFDNIFSECPEAVIYSRGNKITAARGNWQDFNVGSMMYPRYASECSIL